MEFYVFVTYQAKDLNFISLSFYSILQILNVVLNEEVFFITFIYFQNWL